MKSTLALPSALATTPPVLALRPVVRSFARERISDRVHDEIASAIQELRLDPGAALSETELSLQLGVSRTPVREAISRLADQGLVTVVSQVGTSVALIDRAEVEEACFVRCALEVAAFRLACLIDDLDTSALREILIRQENALHTKDADAFFLTDEELHQQVFVLSGYANVWNLVRRSKLQLDRVRRLVIPAALNSRVLLDEHIRIVELLESRDVEAGVSLIESHALHALGELTHLRSEHPNFFTELSENRR